MSRLRLLAAMYDAGLKYMYQLAYILGITPETLSRKLRNPSDKVIDEMIEKLKEWKAQEDKK